MPDSTANDWALLNERTPEALNELFIRHRDFVFRVALSRLQSRDTAEDVAQDVFMRLLTLKRRLLDRASFRTWLYRVTCNAAADRIRQQGRLVALTEPMEQGADEPYAERLTLVNALQLLNKLPERQRDAVMLRCFEHYSTNETADLMGISGGSVKTHLHRGLARLRELLDSPVASAVNQSEAIT